MEIFDILEVKEDQAIIKYLLSIVDVQNINSICDYGCGDGRILKKIEKELPFGKRYIGIDNWSNEHNSNKIPDDEEFIKFVDNGSSSIGEFIESNQYDLVYSSFALHHFRFPIKELKRLECLVAPEGYLILVDLYPDYTDAEKIAANVLHFNSQMMNALKGDYHHVPYTKEEIRDLLLSLNLEIVKQKVINVEINKKELADYKLSFPERLKKSADKVFLDNLSDPVLLEVFKSTLQLIRDVINKYGAVPNNLLVTTAKKMN